MPVDIHAADLSRPDARKAVIEQAGAIDILINNAGAIPKGDLLELVRDLWPRGRMITPKEIADVVAFLASDRASAMCGQVVTVDAGFAARSYGRRRS